MLGWLRLGDLLDLPALAQGELQQGFGITLPTGPLTFEPRTALVGLAVGTLVTVAAAVGPARNAVRIPPVAALADRPSEGDGAGPAPRPLIAGAALTVAGAALLAAALSQPVVAPLGARALCVFLGVAMLAPTVVRRSPARAG